MNKSEHNILPSGEGYVAVEGGRIWYKIVGSGNGIPLILIHGGPGLTSNYLEPLAEISVDRPVIFYDQLGCGKSDKPTNKKLWTLERSVRELEALREALGIEEFHLNGSSYGALVAMEYMKNENKAVKSITFSGAVISITRWIEDTAKIYKTLPISLKNIYKKHEDAGTTDAEEYQLAIMEFYKLYQSRRDPWSEDLMSSFVQFNRSIHLQMFGENIWKPDGNLSTLDRTEDLQLLKLPVLFIAGRYDQASPEATEEYHNLVPGSEMAIIENSGHLTMQDQPDEYISLVRNFLNGLPD